MHRITKRFFKKMFAAEEMRVSCKYSNFEMEISCTCTSLSDFFKKNSTI